MKRNMHNIDLYFAAVSTILLVGLLWRCRYGYGSVDECYYLAVPYRFLQGDAMLRHDWSLVQLFAFPMLPVLSLLLMINGTEGIILSSRFAYVLISFACAWYCYLKLKKFDVIGAFFTGLLMICFVPLGISTLSYNSMGILLLGVSFVTYAGIESVQRRTSFVVGCLFALAVLCNPFLVFMYLMYSVLVLLKMGKLLCGSDRINPENWLWATMGAVLMALLFFLFLMMRSTPGQILQAIPYITNDGVHEIVLLDKIMEPIGFLRNIYNCCLRWLKCCAIICVMALVFRKLKWEYCPGILFIICALFVSWSIWKVYDAHHHINYMSLAANMMVICAFCLTPNKNKSIYRLFWWIYVPGILYMISMQFASNTNHVAFSAASTVSLLGGIPMIMMCAKQIPLFLFSRHSNKNRMQMALLMIALLIITGIRGRSYYPNASTGILLIAAAYMLYCEIKSAMPNIMPENPRHSSICPAPVVLMTVVLLGTILAARYENGFLDLGINAQTVLVTKGAHKGIYVTPEREEALRLRRQTLDPYLEKYGSLKCVMVSRDYCTQGYLYEGVKNACCYAWSGPSMSEETNKAYYTLNPEKIPELVMIEKNLDQSSVRWLVETEDYSMTQTDLAYIYLRNDLVEKEK